MKTRRWQCDVCKDIFYVAVGYHDAYVAGVHIKCLGTVREIAPEPDKLRVI